MRSHESLDTDLYDVRSEPRSESPEQREEDEGPDLTLDAEVRTDVFAEGVAWSLVEDRPELEREEHHERKGVANTEDHSLSFNRGWASPPIRPERTSLPAPTDSPGMSTDRTI